MYVFLDLVLDHLYLYARVTTHINKRVLFIKKIYPAYVL
jgi:hypothetical protein